MKKSCLGLVAAVSLLAGAEVADSINNVIVQQHWPWSPEVSVTFTVNNLEAAESVDVALSGICGNAEVPIPLEVVKGLKRGLAAGAAYTLTFNPMDVPALVQKDRIPDFKVKVTPSKSTIDPSEALYMIVDLEKSADDPAQVTYLSRTDILSGAHGAYEYEADWIEGTEALNDCLIWTGATNDVYKTTKLVLRKIKAGSFKMGLFKTDYPNAPDVNGHEVTLTQDYWIGIYELTQKQWYLVMGTVGSHGSYTGDTRPVNMISYNAFRGTNLGAMWPTNALGEAVGDHSVDADSFLGKLRAKVPGITFDLPTEAQWEYACRAGTTTALNSGKNLTDATACPNLDKLGRYKANVTDGAGGYASGHTAVGSYLPNAWGLYDMHGNVLESVLDWVGLPIGTPKTDPVGAITDTRRTLRGGSCGKPASESCSGLRGANQPSVVDTTMGFRLAVFPAM